MKLGDLLNVFVPTDADPDNGVAMYYHEDDINGPRYSEADILNMKLVFVDRPGHYLKLLSVYPSDKGGRLFIDLGS